MKIVVSFGGGSNSAAVLINMVKHQIIPDEILFSDTGGEHPHTYQFIEVFNQWLISKNFPSIKILKYTNRMGME